MNAPKMKMATVFALEDMDVDGTLWDDEMTHDEVATRIVERIVSETQADYGAANGDGPHMEDRIHIERCSEGHHHVTRRQGEKAESHTFDGEAGALLCVARMLTSPTAD